MGFAKSNPDASTNYLSALTAAGTITKEQISFYIGKDEAGAKKSFVDLGAAQESAMSFGTTPTWFDQPATEDSNFWSFKEVSAIQIGDYEYTATGLTSGFWFEYEEDAPRAIVSTGTQMIKAPDGLGT
jgi:hypothetical protein